MKFLRSRVVKKILALIVCLLLILSLLIGSLSMIFGGAHASTNNGEKITLLFTHGMHSHIEGFPK